MNYWLIKSEPFKYAWETFEKEGRTFWDGVRNYQARNNLKQMQLNDLALFYHSNEGKSVVGIARIVKEAYQDPTTTETQWVVVEVEPVQALPKPVTLADMKAEPELQNMGLLRQPRLSVIALSRTEFDKIVAMGQ